MSSLTNTELYIANLDFLLNYGDGTTKDEIEYELFKIAFQQKETIHYDRENGGSIQDVEQERTSEKDVLMLKFITNMLESVYRNNQKKGFDPFILIGASDFMSALEGTSLIITLYYRLLEEANKVGAIQLEV